MATDVQTEPRGEVADDSAPPPSAGVERPPLLLLLAGLSAAAGLIHAKALFDHATHYWLFGVFFGVLTYVQVLWAVQLYRRPDDRRLFGPIAVMSLGVIAIWLVSRTVGLPIGPWADRAEPIGAADFAATLDEVVIVVLIVSMLRPHGRLAARMRWLDEANCVRVGSMLCALSLMALLLGSHSHAN